jgi:hypothetical protein
MANLQTLLIANRGEIAVRIIRAAKDAGIGTVAIYADQDRNARHVRLAHEAYALNGTTSADTYLVIEKILSIAKRSGANAIHPGYGFLAENSGFAQAVIDSGLIWIGPSPAAIDALGDKVTARHIAEKVGAPLAPGTLNPVSGVDDVKAFVALLAVPGVGPGSAIQLLASVGRHGLREAVARQDPQRIGKVKGVGSKLTARIITDYKPPADDTRPSDEPEFSDHDVVELLTDLGFDRDAARQAVRRNQHLEEAALIAAALEQLRQEHSR